MVLLLNPDARFTSDIVSEMISFLDEHERAGVAGPQLVFPDRSLQNSVDLIPNLLTELVNKSALKILLPRAYPSKRSGFTRPVKVPSIIGACMMIKMQVVDAIGLLDEGFFLYLEETDFCKRVSDAGFEVWHLPGLTICTTRERRKKFRLRQKASTAGSLYVLHKAPRGLVSDSPARPPDIHLARYRVDRGARSSFLPLGQGNAEKIGIPPDLAPCRHACRMGS
jgi:hypothetical protein